MIRWVFAILAGIPLLAMSAAPELKLGDRIPALTLPDQDGKPLDLTAFGSEGYLLGLS